MRSALAFLRTTSTLTKAVVDGWQLVHVGLACERELRPKTWTESFKMVNLHVGGKPIHTCLPVWHRMYDTLVLVVSFASPLGIADFSFNLICIASWRGHGERARQRKRECRSR